MEAKTANQQNANASTERIFEWGAESAVYIRKRRKLEALTWSKWRKKRQVIAAGDVHPAGAAATSRAEKKRKEKKEGERGRCSR